MSSGARCSSIIILNGSGLIYVWTLSSMLCAYTLVRSAERVLSFDCQSIWPHVFSAQMVGKHRLHLDTVSVALVSHLLTKESLLLMYAHKYTNLVRSYPRTFLWITDYSRHMWFRFLQFRRLFAQSMYKWFIEDKTKLLSMSCEICPSTDSHHLKLQNLSWYIMSMIPFSRCTCFLSL